jgi:thioredoxin 1
MAVRSITDAEFEREVLGTDLPVLIDFYADWCQPCKVIAPIIEDLARIYEGRLKVVKVDVDRSPAASEAFRIQSIPTVALLHNRRVVDFIVGAVDRNRLVASIEKVVGPPVSAGAELWDVERSRTALIQQTARFVDIRPAADFARVHLPEALHIPIDELPLRVSELQELGGTAVLYARTDEGVLDLAKKVAETGVRVAALQGGLLAWEAARLPVVKAASRILD